MCDPQLRATLGKIITLFSDFLLYFQRSMSPAPNEDGSVCGSDHCGSVIVTEMYSLTGDPHPLLVEPILHFTTPCPSVSSERHQWNLLKMKNMGIQLESRDVSRLEQI